jgi:hypothetical protein
VSEVTVGHYRHQAYRWFRSSTPPAPSAVSHAPVQSLSSPVWATSSARDLSTCRIARSCPNVGIRTDQAWEYERALHEPQSGLVAAWRVRISQLITFACDNQWLPSLLKHEYIALHFVSQTSHEKAAQMRVSPAHDIVTCVFMLFRRVRSDDVGVWALAAEFTRLWRTARRPGRRSLV